MTGIPVKSQILPSNKCNSAEVQDAINRTIQHKADTLLSKEIYQQEYVGIFLNIIEALVKNKIKYQQWSVENDIIRFISRCWSLWITRHPFLHKRSVIVFKQSSIKLFLQLIAKSKIWLEFAFFLSAFRIQYNMST